MSTPKPITLCVESFADEAGFVAWIDNEKFKGIVVQSDSIKGVLEEMFTSLKVKFAYDYDISIGGVEEKIDDMMKKYFSLKQICPDTRQEINLKFA